MDDISVLPLVLSGFVFLLTFVGIVRERFHRAIVAFAGAVLMVVVGIAFGIYSESQAVTAIDFNTLALLFGLMIVVEIFKTTGFFPYLAIKVGKLARGSPWRLMLTLGLFTTLVSMFLDNVTTIMLVAPVTILLADILGITALPLLMSEALLSNIGGVATLIGDPPNVLIGSAASLSFTDFLIHLAPVAFFAWLLTQALLLLMFRKELSQPPSNLARLEEMDERKALVHPSAARRMVGILTVTIVLFFVHDRIGLQPGFVALIGAALGLLVIRPPLRKILGDMPWDVILFFVSLFVIVGGLEACGLLRLITKAILGLTMYGVEVTALVILWMSAIMASLVDRIPFTIAMLPILGALGAHGVRVEPLWWALALGVGFGANGTPIGSMTNVVMVSISEEAGTPLTFRAWLKKGPVVTFGTCVIASLALIVGIRLGFF
ncbi:TPA: citrate transporter [Candidatus Acetothermia bacterium]|nr:citrate transporter [Candidatus Acetothermia bacterium]